MNSYKQASSILSGAATKEAEDFLKKYPSNTSSSAPLKEESKSKYSSFGLGGKKS
jgi:hypothetical protein